MPPTILKVVPRICRSKKARPVISPAQRTAVQLRPHQQNEREMAATTCWAAQLRVAMNAWATGRQGLRARPQRIGLKSGDNLVAINGNGDWGSERAKGHSQD